MSQAPSPLSLVISGVTGRMGQAILQLVAQSAKFQLAGALEKPGHPAAGSSLQQFCFDLSTDCQISTAPAELLDETVVLIDFTRPAATRKLLEVARQKATPAVIGTTGLSRADRQSLEELAAIVPVVYATNMSTGINLLRKLLVEAAEILDSGFDLEIVEMHHRYKEDAPSGTALTLAGDLARARQQELEDVVCYGRQGFTGKRAPDEIAVLSLRGGDVPGDHTVIFAGDGERLEFTHRASGRETFARGALRAAEFVQTAPPGLYDMDAVLGLS